MTPDPSPNKSSAGAADQTPDSPAFSGGAPHILVVDDNQANRAVVAAFCEIFGCSYDLAQDGLEAVDAVRAGSYDLILMDIQMPRMDGMEATQAIRLLPSPSANVPVIAVTANVERDDVEAYLACGMCGAVAKPIEPRKLLHAISVALHSAGDRHSDWRRAAV